EITFVIFNGEEFFTVTLSKKNYQRLSVCPGLWVAFKGVGDNNLLLNLASIEHNPIESANMPLEEFEYDWEND
ncbi:MAG: hypothetical protein VW124_24300, partial [Paracoccaceae bacterium]